MAERTYFLVNDTRYDNHHGGLTVIRNLHAAMSARGWTCTGSLPVSATASRLNRVRAPLNAAHLVIVNGEGSLHHDTRNTQRLLAICTALQRTHPVAIINASWQNNDPARWKPVLDACTTIYARDRRSQENLNGIGVEADYAPDLTFYDYHEYPKTDGGHYACTDSVIASRTEWALELCRHDPDMDFITLFTRHLDHLRGARDWGRRLKYAVYPPVARWFPEDIPARYRALCYAVDDTSQLLARIASSRAVCAGRYHALCFALQQNTPFVAVPSNSVKIEALIADVGLAQDSYLYYRRDSVSLLAALEHAADAHAEAETAIAAFNLSARRRINAMFDSLTGHQQEPAE